MNSSEPVMGLSGVLAPVARIAYVARVPKFEEAIVQLYVAARLSQYSIALGFGGPADETFDKNGKFDVEMFAAQWGKSPKEGKVSVFMIAFASPARSDLSGDLAAQLIDLRERVEATLTAIALNKNAQTLYAWLVEGTGRDAVLKGARQQGDPTVWTSINWMIVESGLKK